jgi:hypothetical protein
MFGGGRATQKQVLRGFLGSVRVRSLSSNIMMAPLSCPRRLILTRLL